MNVFSHQTKYWRDCLYWKTVYMTCASSHDRLEITKKLIKNQTDLARFLAVDPKILKEFLYQELKLYDLVLFKPRENSSLSNNQIKIQQQKWKKESLQLSDLLADTLNIPPLVIGKFWMGHNKLITHLLIAVKQQKFADFAEAYDKISDNLGDLISVITKSLLVN